LNKNILNFDTLVILIFLISFVDFYIESEAVKRSAKNVESIYCGCAGGFNVH